MPKVNKPRLKRLKGHTGAIVASILTAISIASMPEVQAVIPADKLVWVIAGIAILGGISKSIQK